MIYPVVAAVHSLKFFYPGRTAIPPFINNIAWCICPSASSLIHYLTMYPCSLLKILVTVMSQITSDCDLLSFKVSDSGVCNNIARISSKKDCGPRYFFSTVKSCLCAKMLFSRNVHRSPYV